MNSKFNCNRERHSMTSKPKPLYDPPVPRICPVCGHASYSAGGVHPQCAVRQADSRRLEAAKQRAAQAVAGSGRRQKKAWHRFCPRCQKQVHLRNQRCECGHSFDLVAVRGKK